MLDEAAAAKRRIDSVLQRGRNELATQGTQRPRWGICEKQQIQMEDVTRCYGWLCLLFHFRSPFSGHKVQISLVNMHE